MLARKYARQAGTAANDVRACARAVCCVLCVCVRAYVCVCVWRVESYAQCGLREVLPGVCARAWATKGQAAAHA